MALCAVLMGTAYVAEGLLGRAQAAGTTGIVARARQASSVVAAHGATTDVPLSGNTWTQAADEMELVAGTVVIRGPAGCTGSFLNALTLSVDGRPVTFAAVPVVPTPTSSSDQPVQFLVGAIIEPGQDTDHTMTAKFGNACTRGGEDYHVQNLSVDILAFH
jgi:hypothetical protein